jgi:NAD(P)-dependent dehydrogenase (short-subunit alcohol dehydrogenase family)
MIKQHLWKKRCLIVGGTTGIGRAATQRFLEEGASVVISGRDAINGMCTSRDLAVAGKITFFTSDATQPAQVESLIADATRFLGGLDVLYHVAGISGRKFGDGPLHECTDEGWAATLNANLTSTFLTNRAAVRYFLEKKQPGVILNMASVLAFSPSPRHFDTIAYAATKGGIISISRLAAARYAPNKIRVNVIAPSLIDTPMAGRAVQDEAIRHFLQTKQPLAQGPGTADDCAGAAVFLCSDAASFITGAVLPVDGGWCVSEGQWEE